MELLSRSNSLLVSLLLLSVVLPTGSADDSQVLGQNSEITSDLESGVWFNQTLIINGTTTLPAQDANWALYDVTDPYSSWELLRNGDYFTEVIPIDDGLWFWSISVDVDGLNCTCWLEISQPVGLEKEFLNRIIFIGEGPHNPVISPLHENTIIIDEPVTLSAIGTHSDSDPSDSKLSISWCYAPQGACEGNTSISEINVNWSDSTASFIIDANELGLSDGVWKFDYWLQDVYLRNSPIVEVTFYVDQTNPEAELICPQQAFEGDLVVIDGSLSRDGVWGPNLQAVWYVINPDGAIRVVEQSETNEMVFTLIPEQSGIYSIQLDVVDMVGRLSSTSTTINIENVNPTLNLLVDGLDVSDSASWKLVEGESLKMAVLAHDTGSDGESIAYSWYIDDKIVSETSQILVKDLGVGTHELRLVIVDDNGAEITHNMDVVVSENTNSLNDELNIMAILMFIAIIGVIVIYVRRKKLTEYESSSMPKWGASGKSSSDVNTKTNPDDNEIWNDSAASYGGKD